MNACGRGGPIESSQVGYVFVSSGSVSTGIRA
jgi:hypothetical protein